MEEDHVIQILLKAVRVQIIGAEMDDIDYRKILIVVTQIGMVDALETQDRWLLIQELVPVLTSNCNCNVSNMNIQKQGCLMQQHLNSNGNSIQPSCGCFQL